MTEPIQDLILAGEVQKLTSRQDHFCRLWVDIRNSAAAWRLSYGDGAMRASTPEAYQHGQRILAHPAIQARISELRSIAASETVVRASEILRDLCDIMTADPNELVRLTRANCRHCRGEAYAYQWRTAKEFGAALDQHSKTIAAYERSQARKPNPKIEPPVAPSAEGGFGFDHHAEPLPDCPVCYGEGVVRVTAQDTTRLSPAARKLFKGVKQKADGTIEILMHDQMEARDMVNRMMGVYGKEGAAVKPTPTRKVEEIPESLTAEDAQQRYLALIRG